MRFMFFVLLLAGMAYFTYRYREKIAGWLPGAKQYIWQTIVAAFGILTSVLGELGTVNWADLVKPEHVAMVTIFVAVVSVLIRMVTPAQKPPPDPEELD